MFDPRLNLKRLEKEIVAFEQQPIDEGKILFVGSSAFTRWKEKYHNANLEDEIRMKNGDKAVVNHGFGSSTAEELLYYYPRIIRPWKPRALVIQEFLNDHGHGYTSEEIAYMLFRVCDYARTDFPGIKIFLCDVHPITTHLNDKGSFPIHVREFNNLLRDYCEKHDDCTYVSQVESPMWFADPADAGDYNKIRTDLFIADGVHYTQEGYGLYREFFKEVLDELL